MKWYVIVNTEYSGQPATRYFCGFAGSTSVFLFTEDLKRGYLLIDSRYWEIESQIIQLSKKINKLKIVKVSKDYPVKQAVENICEAEKFREIEIDSTITSYSAYKKLLLFGLNVTSRENIFEKWRNVKTVDEIEKIKKAIDISEKAFQKVIKYIVAGTKESEIAARLEYEMKIRGAEKTAFETIVAPGVRAAVPHAQTSTKIIESTDSVIIDFGCNFEGYASDLTKTVLMPEAGEELRKIYKIVEQAQSAAVKALKPGIAASAVDRVARSIIEGGGYGDKFLHSTGHGVGMDVHESPHIGATSKDMIEKGNVVTIEPGIYIPGLGGVRIETTEFVEWWL